MPGGVGTFGCGMLTGAAAVVVAEAAGICVVSIFTLEAVSILSCQWPCSGDQSLPAGAGPGG